MMISDPAPPFPLGKRDEQAWTVGRGARAGMRERATARNRS